MDSFNVDPEIMWRPDRNKLTKMDEFRSHVNKAFGLKLGRFLMSYIVSHGYMI